MLPKTHFILTLLLSLILYALSFATPLQAAIILAAGVLIDVDHWLIYAIKRKDLSIRKAYKWFYGFNERKEHKRFLYIFHTFESFLIILLIGLKFTIFLWVFLGMAFHLLMDFIEAIKLKHYGKYPSIILRIMKTSKGESILG